MRELSTADVLEVAKNTGLTAKELRLWCEQGCVKPDDNGGGHGRHRRFSVMQTVGIVVAATIRHSERGCVLPYVETVVAAFSAMSEEELEKRLTEDGPCLVTISQGRPVFQGPSFDWVDVAAIYHLVTTRIARIERRLKHHVGGRTRGLAGLAKREAKAQ